MRNIRLKNYLGILRECGASEEITGIILVFKETILQKTLKNYSVT